MTQPRIRSSVLSAGRSSVAGSMRLCKVLGGGTVIVKSIYVDNRSPAANAIEVYLRHIVDGSLTVLMRDAPEAHTPARWDGWAVMMDGDEIVADFQAIDFFFWISGTVLGGSIDPTVTPLGVAALPADSA